MTTIDDSENISLNINSPDDVNKFLGEYTWERKWENVIMMYYEFPEAHTAIISNSAGTALHVAIDLNEEIVVKELVNAILTHNVEVGDERVKALEIGNERGDTPLHFAASRGFARICKSIIGNNNERIYLLSYKNKDGETPLFQAAINWRKQTFAYLAHISKDIVELQDLIRKDGDSILHTAIRGENFDLAVIICYYYDFLAAHQSNDESTPLKLLANKPSAFKSSSNLPWYKRIIYHDILVEPMDAENTVRSILRTVEEDPADPVSNEYPENYGALCDFVSIIPTLFGKKKQYDPEDPTDAYRRPFGSEDYPVGFFPPNYKTFHRFVKCALACASVLTLGLLGLDLKDVKIAKKKHLWSSQLLKALMKRPYAAFTGSGGGPADRDIDPDIYNVFGQRHIRNKIGETNRFDEEQQKLHEITEIKTEYKEEVDKKLTPLLVAATNGIVEMVNEILNKIPSAIYDTNSRKENVLLVAVKWRQFLVVETLTRYVDSNPEFWNILIHAKDEFQNTILHLAAEAQIVDKLGQNIAGSALHMMWDIKWFQYIKNLVPEEFYFISNIFGDTAGEIFMETHKGLIENSNEWIKKTSESCSVVAVLIAGAAFTTASAVPGGTTEGRPILEDNPAFNVFAFASLSGLCFSVTSLIMFLSLITSRKQVNDFRRDLPLKLYIGLSSLFVSLASMFVSFCTGHFFLLSHRFKWILFPAYAAACFPVAYYGVAQFPLYIYLLTTIFSKLPRPIENNGDF